MCGRHADNTRMNLRNVSGDLQTMRAPYGAALMRGAKSLRRSPLGPQTHFLTFRPFARRETDRHSSSRLPSDQTIPCGKRDTKFFAESSSGGPENVPGCNEQ